MRVRLTEDITSEMMGGSYICLSCAVPEYLVTATSVNFDNFPEEHEGVRLSSASIIQVMPGSFFRQMVKEGVIEIIGE